MKYPIIKKISLFVKSHFIEICLVIITICLIKLAFFNEDMRLIRNELRKIHISSPLF